MIVNNHALAQIDSCFSILDGLALIRQDIEMAFCQSIRTRSCGKVLLRMLSVEKLNNFTFLGLLKSDLSKFDVLFGIR